eukprot:1957291-Amphidinium_carterae.1
MSKATYYSIECFTIAHKWYSLLGPVPFLRPIECAYINPSLLVCNSQTASPTGCAVRQKD